MIIGLAVISFDRDLTVESGGGPIGLPIVERFIKNSDWKTYAHGNQRLVNEAPEITGMDEVRSRTDVVHEAGSFASHARESLRENRLKAIRSLEPDADRLVCVDDVDLNHLSDWEYYFPRDFLDVYPERFFQST